MKYLLTIAILLASVATAFSGFKSTQVLTNISSVPGTAYYSTPINVSGYSRKSLQANGSVRAGVLMNYTTMAGTLSAEGGPTLTGPFTPLAQEDGTAVSFTSNGLLSWTDCVNFIRIKWSKTSKKINAWLNYSDN
jgi:hypothetical protein